MRYVVAMVFALIGFGLAAVFLSSQAADWVLARQGFESPDDADNMHMMVYIGTNVLGLVVGWLVGWALAGGKGARTRST
jgi:hypothetical protein